MSYKKIELDTGSIDYDQDSEEEYDDMNGENLAALEEFSDDEDAYAHDLFDDGFIIADDDYAQLSETSYENLDDGERMPKNLNRY